MRDPKGVVAAGHKVTAEAAAEVLREGGNAFDAAIAAMATATVPEFVFSSVGGGGFLMARPANSKTAICYDFFAQTPATKRGEDEIEFHAIQADFGPATQEFHIGAGSAAVPGFVPGLHAIHADLGSLPMVRLLEPAILAARDGVTISPLHAYLYTIVAPILTATPEARRYFAPNDEKLLRAGDVYRNAEISDTLDTLAREGPRLFTEGEVAQAMTAQSNDLGGHLNLEDLRGYKVERRVPLAWRYRGHELLLNPAPAASGALIAFGLALLEKHLPEGAPDPVQLARIMEETNTVRMARGNALHEIVREKTIESHLQALAGHTPATRGTTHISIIDAQGNAAAATITNGEGNGHIVKGCGFMLNNMLGEEDLNPGGFHRWQPDTRLSTMMAPTIALSPDGALTALGSGGSNRIRTAILQVVINLFDRKMGLDGAINAARLHVERDGAVSFEEAPWEIAFNEDERSALLKAYPHAHAWPEENLFFGGVHSARRDDKGRLEGAGDPRREGCVVVV